MNHINIQSGNNIEKIEQSRENLSLISFLYTIENIYKKKKKY